MREKTRKMSYHDIRMFTLSLVSKVNRGLEYRTTITDPSYVSQPEFAIFVSLKDLKQDEWAYERVIKALTNHYSDAGYIVERKEHGLVLRW